MKSIKKFLVVALAFLFTVSLTGCDKKVGSSGIKPEEAFKKSGEFMKTVNNYDITMKISLGAHISISGFEMDFTTAVGLNGKVDVKNKAVYMSLDLTELEKTEKNELYITYDEASSMANLVANDGAGWYKVSKQINNYNPSDAYNINLMDTLLSKTNIKEIEEDDNCYNYEVKLSKEELAKFLSLGTEGNSSLVNISDGTKILVSLNKKDYSLNKISFDMLDVLGASKTEGVEYKNATYELIFNNYNTSGDITVPEEILNSAVEMTTTPISE